MFQFTYKHCFENGLTEHEIDHVFVGYTDDRPTINTDEVNDYKYMHLDDIVSDIALYPERYTVWFKILISQYFDRLISFNHK